jgi:hypothetical protein
VNDERAWVYVGAEVEQGLALRVLEYSIRRHTTLRVEFKSLHEAVSDAGIVIPTPQDPRNRARTPFSFQRFAIPELRGHAGRAIYLDSDMQVFRDLRELWEWPFDTADLLSVEPEPSSGRRGQFSVMVLDCSALHWSADEIVSGLDAGRYDYQRLLSEMCVAQRIARVLPPRWNSLESFQPGITALTHYTDMNRQPWLTTVNPLCELWCEELLRAIAEGFIPGDLVADHVARGWVRPSLVEQVKLGIARPSQLPPRILQRDRLLFTPPHRFSPALREAAELGREPGALARWVRLGHALVSRLRSREGR